LNKVSFSLQDDFINSSEISDAIVPTSALAPVASGGVPFSPITISGSMFTQIPVQQQQLRQTLVQMQPIQDNHEYFNKNELPFAPLKFEKIFNPLQSEKKIKLPLFSES